MQRITFPKEGLKSGIRSDLHRILGGENLLKTKTKCSYGLSISWVSLCILPMEIGGEHTYICVHIYIYIGNLQF